MIIIIFFLATLQKVLPYSIKESYYTSNYFAVSDYFLYSNAFKYSNNNFIYSNTFKYSNNNYISNSHKALKSYNVYLTQIDSLIKSTNFYSLMSEKKSITLQSNMMPTFMPSIKPSAKTTLNPTFIPTFMPTLMPTMVPTVKHTLIPTTILPTFEPTFKVNSYLKIETSMTISGFLIPILDDKSKTAIILSISYSANISSNYISIKEYSFINNRRRLSFSLKNIYNLLLVSQIIIPLINNNINSNSLYVEITNDIQNAILSGAFITYLQGMNSSISNLNISISNYTFSQISGFQPTSAPTIFQDVLNVPELSTIEVIKIVFITIAGFIGFLFIFIQVIKKVNGYTSSSRQNTVSENEIHISI